MRCSLIDVVQQCGEIVEGTWIQNFTGPLDEAAQWARDTEKVNGGRIMVAVVDEIIGTNLIGVYRKGLKRLNIR